VIFDELVKRKRRKRYWNKSS